VLGIHGGTVPLGIDAPPEVPILRQEVVGKPRPNAPPKEPEPCAG
jgi:sRNA-binding carbon storage regulator CsrA